MRILLISFFLVATSLAAPPKVLKDINNNYQGRSIPVSAQSGSTVFFARTTLEHGNELWKTDGVTASLVKDIEPGASSSVPFVFKPVDGGGIYFTADTSAHGRELWFSDGTESGTVLVKDINPGTSPGITSLAPNNFYVIPGSSYIFFAADDGTNGIEPWISDGTSGGTQLYSNLNTGSASSNPSNFFNVGGYLFFSAETNSTGREPFIAFGGSAGVLSDIAPGANSSNPYVFILNSAENKVLFNAASNAAGNELWQTTVGTTSLVKDIVPGTNGGFFSSFTKLPSATVFAHVDVTSGSPVSKIMKSDGTESGTTTVKDLNCIPGGIFSVAYPQYFSKGSVTNNKLVFPCLEGTSFDQALMEPWVTDGTEAGTRMIADIFPGPRGSYLSGTIVGTERTIIPANDGRRGIELWSTDGSTISRIADYNPGEASAYDFDYYGFFFVLGGDAPYNSTVLPLRKGRRVFGVYTNGTSLTELYDDSNTSITAPSEPQEFTPLGDSFIFAARDSKLGREPIISNGKKRGTKVLKNIFKSGDSSPASFVSIPDDRAVFIADSPKYGAELWLTDGVTTKMIKDVGPNELFGAHLNFKKLLKGKMYFRGDDGTTGSELWVTNFTKRGTKLVKDINVGSGSSNPGDFTVFKRKGYFRADDGVLGSELWVTKGRNTTLVSDIRAGAQSSSPELLTVVGNKMFFSANDGVNGRELWMTDGTTVSLVKDIYPGATGSSPQEFVSSGGKLFFVADHPTYGEELWVSDGTEAGTNLVTDLRSGAGDARIEYMAAFSGGRVMFKAYTPATGDELYIADSSSATLLKDIQAGASSSDPQDLFRIPGKRLVYFSATTSEHGRELWRSDGTEAGTVFVADLYAGAENSSPRDFFYHKRKLYFSAHDTTKGREVFSVRVN